MKILKRIVVVTVGLKNYFLLVSRFYFILYRSGLLRPFKNFDCHYYIRNLIKEGGHVIDIGANFGYYTVLFADLVGEKGRVYAVEPVTLYREILKRNIGKRQNVELLPYALGKENKAGVTMAIPGSDISRHGLTKIVSEADSGGAKTFTVEMRNPLELFSEIPTIDYIKCDVEGYELQIIPIILPLIEKHQPILQLETEGQNKMTIIGLMEEIGYETYYVVGKELIRLKDANKNQQGDLFFLKN